jgi:hypothetical protein
MTKKIIIGLAIAVPLVGIYLYRKSKTKTRRRTGTAPAVNTRQQIYNMQQGQILRDKFIAGGILKESEIPN